MGLAVPGARTSTSTRPPRIRGALGFLGLSLRIWAEGCQYAVLFLLRCLQGCGVKSSGFGSGFSFFFFFLGGGFRVVLGSFLLSAAGVSGL